MEKTQPRQRYFIKGKANRNVIITNFDQVNFIYHRYGFGRCKGCVREYCASCHESHIKECNKQYHKYN